MRWLRLFKFTRGARNASEPSDTIQGPRRRDATRYALTARVRVRCSSWPAAAELVTGDVSDTGLFVRSERRAERGERVTLELDAGGGDVLSLSGVVVQYVEAGGSRHGAGFGVRLDEPGDETAAGFRKVVEVARAGAPQPPPPDVPAADDDILELDEDELIELDDVDVLDLEESHAEAPDSAPPPPAVEPAPPAGPTLVTGARRPDVIVGIDLGTTYTSVAAVVGSRVAILPRADGKKSTPSVITFPDRDSISIGDRDAIATDPLHTIVSPKRILGLPFENTEVQRFLTQAPYRALEGPDGTCVIEMWGDHYAVPQLISYLLDDARLLAEEHLGTAVKHAVVSVPIAFDAPRIEALRRAGHMASLDVVAVIDEPSAAALANRFEKSFGGVVGVYDFGGGTFDFSVVDVSQGDFRVLATAGDTWLGGDDFDEVLATAAANQFWRKHHVDLKVQAAEWQRLLFACERAKRVLTSKQRAAIQVPEVLRTADGMLDLNFTIDRDILARAAAPIISQSLRTCDEALDLIGMQPGDLSAVYLSGGTTYVPAVRQALARHFDVPILTGVPPEHAVCLGAAVHAAQLQFQSGATLTERG